jgi:hypothetical protein
MPITFTNPETADMFETDFENDVKLIVSCECNGGKGFSGMLSNIPPGAATALVIQKSNLVRFKPIKRELVEEN